ncbi:MAG: PilX N-terminal domain-containing pilus assembly protein [Thiotrichales bacterium]
MRLNGNTGPGQQRGAVLIVALLILLVMTIIGVSAMKSTTLDERIAANTQFKTTTFQTSESALAEASTFAQVENCFTASCRVCDDRDPDERRARDNDYFLDHEQGPILVDREYAVGRADPEAESTINAIGMARMCDRGVVTITGTSIGVGGAAPLALRVFDVTAVGLLDGTGAYSVHHQRVGRVAPGSAR